MLNLYMLFSKTNVKNVQKVDETESDRGSRQPATVVQTSSECVKGVDLAVGRRIKWLIGGARRGEGAKRSALPLPVSLSLPPSFSLPLPGEKAIGAEQTNHMAMKHYSPLLLWDFIQTAFYWSPQCARTHIQKDEHTRACMQTHTLLTAPINMTVVLQVPIV